MRGFAILGRANEETVKERHPVASKILGVNKLIQPYMDEEYDFNGLTCRRINITHGFENNKIKRACRFGQQRYGRVISKDFNINYNPFFHHSCLIRGLDFLTVSKGCDLRLSEVVIADAATDEGRNIFRLLLPIARRIILVTTRKEKLNEEVDYALFKYGTSAAVVEDPVRAAERADVVIIASSNLDHRFLLEIERPMLYLRYLYKPKTNMWFDDVDISFGKVHNLNTVYAQGYVEAYSRMPIWGSAERDGFRIDGIKRTNSHIIVK